jgi:hypothetical protein
VFSELYYKSADWRVGIGPVLERTFFAWEGDRFGYGIQGSVQRRIGAGGDTLRWIGRIRYLEYDDREEFDGAEYTSGLRYQHGFSASLMGNLGVSATFMEARKDFNAYKHLRPYFEVLF